MPEVPLALAIPAVAAGLAYLNVKTGAWVDWQLIRGTVPATLKTLYREKIDRVNLFYKLEWRATSRSTANRTYLLYQDKSWTYAQCYEMALKWGNCLKDKYNLKSGDVVALDMMNSDQYVLICFGLWCIGVKPALINYNLTGKALTHCVQAANAVLMLVDPEVEDKVDDDVRTVLSSLRIEPLSPEIMVEAMATDPVRPPDSLRSGDVGKDMALLIYTSGTTGLPKAAIVSWSKMIMAGNFIGGWLATRPQDVFYTCMPIYHSSASILGFGHMLETGATFAIGRKFSTKTFWKEVRMYKATIIQYVGETCRYLLTAPPELDPVTGENLDKMHNVRIAFGNGLRPDVWERFRDRFGIENISEFYGSTEGFIVLVNSTRNEYASGAIGRNGWLYGALMGGRIAIVDVDQETDIPYRDPKTKLSRQVPRGHVGELMLNLPDVTDIHSTFQGYYNNKKATESKIVRDILKKGDAFFRTGDLVSWDKEGRIYFHDRIGDTFRWKSENVATTEVSQVMGLHPAVAEANVYGVQLPNHDGRAGCAAIVLKEATSERLMADIAAHARQRLPKYAIPVFLRVVKDMSPQMTGTNKHQKHELRLQGVDPDKTGQDQVWWQKDGPGGDWVRFTRDDWTALNSGRVKL